MLCLESQKFAEVVITHLLFWQEDVSESKRSQLEFVTEEDTGHLVEEPDTSSFTAFLYSLLSSSESGNNPKLDEQNDHSAQMGDQLSENVAKESGTKKGLFPRGKQALRAVYQATRIGGNRSQESKGNSDSKNVDENDDFGGLEVKMPKQNMKEPVALGDLPDISEPSLLLSEKERSTLYVSLPALVQGRKWLLLYRYRSTDFKYTIDFKIYIVMWLIAR